MSRLQPQPRLFGERMGDIWQARSEGILEGVSLDGRRVSEDGENAGGAVGLKRKSWRGKAAALGLSKVCVGGV